MYILTLNLTLSRIYACVFLPTTPTEDDLKERKESRSTPKPQPEEKKNAPNEDDGPPTLVLFMAPEPTPGLKRTPTDDPGASSAILCSWEREHALMSTPDLSSSAASEGSSWELFD